MPGDLASLIRELRHDSRPSHDELQEALIEVAQAVGNLSREVAELRQRVDRSERRYPLVD